MKPFFLLLSIVLLALTFGCSDDEDTNANAAAFAYDLGPNSAPLFGIGVHQAAARFPSAVTAPFNGNLLERVEFYLVNTPSNTRIIIYDEGPTSTEPGPILYEADVTVDATPNSLNTHTLTEDVNITGNDLWIAIEFTHPDERNTIGCDAGPAVANGDFVRTPSELDFTTYRTFTSGAVDINWNIRGFVAE